MADNAENLASLIAVGHSVREAAQEVGITENVAYKMSAKPEFKAMVYAIRTEKTEGLAAMALGAAAAAIAQLKQLATGAEKESDQIAACNAVLKQVLPLAENSELRRRLDDLERGALEQAEQT